MSSEVDEVVLYITIYAWAVSGFVGTSSGGVDLYLHNSQRPNIVYVMSCTVPIYGNGCLQANS
jgi:hypothetical protein